MDNFVFHFEPIHSLSETPFEQLTRGKYCLKTTICGAIRLRINFLTKNKSYWNTFFWFHPNKLQSRGINDGVVIRSSYSDCERNVPFIPKNLENNT